jgi:hypothetical protein
MWIVALVLVGIAGLVAIGNIQGCIWARQNKKKGIDKGYSNVPFVSFFSCIFAYFLGRETLGFWVFIPTIIDPGTLSTLYFPWVIWTEFIRPKFIK